MPRVKRGKNKTKKRNKILKEAKGFRGRRKKSKRLAKQAVMRKWKNQFIGRKLKKRNFRRLWNVKINAAARNNGTKYSELIHLLKKKNVKLDRKMLANLAEHEPEVFEKVVDFVQKSTTNDQQPTTNDKPDKKEKNS